MTQISFWIKKYLYDNLMILLVSQMMLWPKFRSFVTFFFWGFLWSYKILIFFSYMFVCRGLLWWFVDKWKERHGRGMWGEGEEDDDDGVCGLPKAKEITTFKSFSLWTNQTSKIVCQVCFPIWSHNCTLFLGACIFFPLLWKVLVLFCLVFFYAVTMRRWQIQKLGQSCLT